MGLNVDSQISTAGSGAGSLGRQELCPSRGAGEQHHVGAPRLKQLEQVVHGCVGSELRDGAHAEGRDRNVGKNVNEDELLDQNQTNDCFPAKGKRSWVSEFNWEGGGAGGERREESVGSGQTLLVLQQQTEIA